MKLNYYKYPSGITSRTSIPHLFKAE